MSLLTSNRFSPQINQPRLTMDVVSNHKKLFDFLEQQQRAITNLTNALATVLNGSSGMGLLADRPTTTTLGSFFYATDVSHLYEYGPNGWITLV